MYKLESSISKFTAFPFLYGDSCGGYFSHVTDEEK